MAKARAAENAADRARQAGQMLALTPDGKIVTANGDILLEGAKVEYLMGFFFLIVYQIERWETNVFIVV